MRYQKYFAEKSIWTTNKHVYRVVVTLCADYKRRKKVIAEGKIDSVHIEYYKLLNDAIDRALEKGVDCDIREQMLEDIGNRVGPYNSRCCLYMSVGTYKAQKREAVYNIAKNLQLL